MATYLLKWNPKEWSWDNLESDIATIRRTGYQDFDWTCGKTKKIKPGDRAFLSRTSVPPCGVVGSGYFTGTPFLCPHSDKSRPKAKMLRAPVRIDYLLNPGCEQILPIERLDKADLVDGPWHTQGGGHTIPSGTANRLETVWKEFQNGRVNSPNFDRNSLESANIVFHRLFKNTKARQICIGSMADSVRIAQVESPSSWGITLFNDAVRLNVGLIEVLVYSKEHVVCLVSSESISAKLIKHPDVHLEAPSGGIHRSVAVSASCSFPSEKADELFSLVRESHHQLICAAAKGQINPAARKAYSPGVTEFLAVETGHHITHPAYYRGEQVRSGHPNLVYAEGEARHVQQTVYERNPYARSACIQHYGHDCVVCGFDFGTFYGELGNGFIHVHHLAQLSKVARRRAVEPVRDLRPVCPNCHAMLHACKEPLSIEELKKLVMANGKRP